MFHSSSKHSGGAAFKWDILAGALMMAAAGGFLYVGSGLRLGSIGRMGPGYVPMMVAGILAVLGLVIAVDALRGTTHDRPEWPRLRALLTVVACPVVFALLIVPFGLVPTILVVATIAQFAQPVTFGWGVVVLPVLLAVFCVVVFVHLLRVSIPVFW